MSALGLIGIDRKIGLWKEKHGCWLCVSGGNRAMLLPVSPGGQQWCCPHQMGDSMPSPAFTPDAFAPDPDAARHQHGNPTGTRAHTVPLCLWAGLRVDLALPAASPPTLALTLSSVPGCWQDLNGNKSHLPSPSPSSNASAPLQGCRLLSFF